MTVTTYVCFVLMPLGDALTLIFSSPAVTCLFSRVFLGVRLRLWKVVFIALLIAGVVLVIQPPLFFPRVSDQLDSIQASAASSNDVTLDLSELRAKPC